MILYNDVLYQMGMTSIFIIGIILPNTHVYCKCICLWPHDSLFIETLNDMHGMVTVKQVSSIRYIYIYREKKGICTNDLLEHRTYVSMIKILYVM